MLRRPLARVLAAEFVGAFALVFAGCGAVMVDAKRQALGHVGVALSFGLVVMVMIYAVGHISGAHFKSFAGFSDEQFADRLTTGCNHGLHRGSILRCQLWLHRLAASARASDIGWWQHNQTMDLRLSVLCHAG